jgi:hypothetical protein
MIKKEEHWRKLIKSFEESGLAPGEFCKNQGISSSRFRFYRKKFREAQAELPVSKASFEPLIITPSPTSRTNFKLVVELPNKIRCELAAVDSTHQMALLKELMTLC